MKHGPAGALHAFRQYIAEHFPYKNRTDPFRQYIVEHLRYKNARNDAPRSAPIGWIRRMRTKASPRLADQSNRGTSSKSGSKRRFEHALRTKATEARAPRPPDPCIRRIQPTGADRGASFRAFFSSKCSANVSGDGAPYFSRVNVLQMLVENG